MCAFVIPVVVQLEGRVLIFDSVPQDLGRCCCFHLAFNNVAHVATSVLTKLPCELIRGGEEKIDEGHCYAGGTTLCLKVTPYFSPFVVVRPLHALEPAGSGLLLPSVALFQVVHCHTKLQTGTLSSVRHWAGLSPFSSSVLY